ncbi:MAG TPA: tetratricopeptide repeat protein, partial [Gemmatimonadales bacterium]|nr:tetratricopeptide repeat protein [Gemmatimonadales bacterium]
MRVKFPPSAAVASVNLMLTLLLPTRATAQVSCPRSAMTALEAGWRSYRAGANQSAAEHFAVAHQACPQSIDARVGLGLAQLRLGRTQDADSMFRSVLARDTTNADAWDGRARSSLRLGDTAVAVLAARRALSLAPANQEIRRLLDDISPDWDRPILPIPQRRAPTLQVTSRTRGRGFEVNAGSGWRAFYIKGVNFGVALPGRFPSEFPQDSATYAGWIDTLAAMNANTLRLYTILPPQFYRALRAWNLAHPQRLLWLVHGVWAELPPRHDFNDSGWKGEFQNELKKVVDVIHGAANIPSRRGHAGGRYDADVSAWVLGYIVGREWEPFAVEEFVSRNRPSTYTGSYLRTRGPASAMDVWLVQQCDFMLQFEAGKYNALRPIAYTNWPTLDPLHHPTEATSAEETRWRKRSGRRSEVTKVEYENDAVALDATLVEATPANPAGWFASYHAYPYYPDFLLLDPGYRKARSAEGPSSYYGYLRELIAYHRTIPTV